MLIPAYNDVPLKAACRIRNQRAPIAASARRLAVRSNDMTPAEVPALLALGVLPLARLPVRPPIGVLEVKTGLVACCLRHLGVVTFPPCPCYSSSSLYEPQSFTHQCTSSSALCGLLFLSMNSCNTAGDTFRSGTRSANSSAMQAKSARLASLLSRLAPGSLVPSLSSHSYMQEKPAGLRRPERVMPLLGPWPC